MAHVYVDRSSRCPRLWSGRASSREINLTSSDETADGRYRCILYETRLERRRWLRTDEMATNGGRARTSSGRLQSRGSKGALNASKSAHTFDFHVTFGCLEVVTSSMVHVLMALRPVALYNANLGPWRVRKCPIGWAPAGRPSSVRISHIFIFKPFDRVFLLYLAAQL